MDFRFHKAICCWVNENGLTKDYDLVSIAGAQKALLDEDTRATVLKQIELSVKLHGINTVIFMAHQDCGAYGGSDSFDDDESEKAKYDEDMTTAEEIVKKKYPDIAVRKMLVVFNEDEEIEIKEL
ncbi:hypothetical protein HN858_00920 [Candidatus Falkowbacteria bacterium]|nr:hypothetical protein [Candidatus Falkowbacteria bacterium]